MLCAKLLSVNHRGECQKFDPGVCAEVGALNFWVEARKWLRGACNVSSLLVVPLSRCLAA
jgi:hypothetical protein